MNVRLTVRTFCESALFILGALAAVAAAQTTETLRVVTYNMEADIRNSTDPAVVKTPRPGFYQVLEGIGEENILGNVQPIDILGLQETTSNTLTVQPIVNALNSYYGAGTYAMSTYQATESNNSPSGGNGPNALVYNAKVLQLVASVPVDPAGGISQLGSASGEYREVMRYQFQPVGGSAADDFYVYVSHYKSGSSSSDAISRNGEATIIRQDEAANLPASARVVYVGDYNFGTSTEQTYQTLTAVNSPSPNSKAQGRAVDVYNPPDQNGNVNYNITWDNSSNLTKLSDSTTNLQYRDDYQTMTQNVFNGTAGGLAYIPGSYQVFGNNGSVSYHGGISGGGNTALSNLMLRGDVNLDGSVSAADIKQMLGALSDLSTYQSAHSLSNSALFAVADVNRDGKINNADLQALLSEVMNLNSATAPVTRSTVLADLSTASDHLPGVADYTVSVTGVGSLAAVPEPSTFALLSAGGLFLLCRRITGRRVS